MPPPFRLHRAFARRGIALERDGAVVRVRRNDTDTDTDTDTTILLLAELPLEEDPSAYKPIGLVLRSQEEAGIPRAAVRLRPWRTFKA